MPNIRHNLIPDLVYQEVRLEQPSEQIRLLSVQPRVAGKPLCCALQVVTLRSSPIFTALSYTWRNALLPEPKEATRIEKSFKIICNGKACRILENLYEALQQLGRRTDTYFWIDAICINQRHLGEKTAQVQLLSMVYQKATSVSVWLGKCDKHAENAVKLIEHLSLLEPNELATINLNTLATATVAEFLDEECQQREMWVSLAHFLRRTWFTRAWVVQEVILAQPGGLLVHCGKHDISWAALRKVSGYLSRSSWRETFADPDFLGDDQAPPRVSAAAKIGGTQDDIARMTQASFSGEPHDLFLDTLIRVREFDCEWRRDKAYCCYGIGMRYRPRDFPLPLPDYSLAISDAEAFTRTAQAVLRMSQSLHLLAYVESLRSNDLAGRTEMPSWVPDWSVTKKVGLGITGYRRYWSAGNLTQIVGFADEPYNRVLRLRAANVDEVAELGNSKDEIARGQDLDATIRVLRHMKRDYGVGTSQRRQSCEEVFWRTLVHDTCPEDHCPALPTVGGQFRPWLRERTGNSVVELMDLLDNLDRAKVDKVPNDASMGLIKYEDTLQSQQAPHFGDNFALRTCLKLFRTTSGLLGLGAEAVDCGDSVWIVPGSRVPLILRRCMEPTNSVYYQLVGAAYIHGVMHGEALEKFPPLHFQETIRIS